MNLKSCELPTVKSKNLFKEVKQDVAMGNRANFPRQQHHFNVQTWLPYPIAPHSTKNRYIIRMKPENSKRGGERNLNNRASLPPHSPVGQQGISRDNNSFFLYLNIFFIVFPKSTQA